jgi:hypothetical protein
MISPTRALALAASIAMPVSVCGFSRGITGNSGIPFIFTAGHDSESLAALRGAECLHKIVDRSPTLEEPE